MALEIFDSVATIQVAAVEDFFNARIEAVHEACKPMETRVIFLLLGKEPERFAEVTAERTDLRLRRVLCVLRRIRRGL